MTSTRRRRCGKHRFEVNGCEFVVDDCYMPNVFLGSGASGMVVSAMDNNDETNAKPVAIKKILCDDKSLKRALREVLLLKHFDHPNIIKIDRVMEVRGADAYVAFERMDTDLHKVIYSTNQLTDDHIQYFIYQTLCALKCFHSANVIHHNIKSSKLLVNADCTLKICGVGSACSFENVRAEEYNVSQWNRAPEVLCRCSHYDHKIDVWSTGCILGELLGREPLFTGDDLTSRVTSIVKVLGTPPEADLAFLTDKNAVNFINNLPFTKQTSFKRMFPHSNPLALDLLEHMLAFNPSKRYTVDECLAHPYMEESVDDLDNHLRDCPPSFDFNFDQINMSHEQAIEGK